MKNIKIIVALICVTLILTTSFSAFAAFAPRADLVYQWNKAQLSTGMKLVVSAQTFEDCAKLGTKSYTLYKADGSAVKTWSPASYVKSDMYSEIFDLSSVAKRGQSYYVKVTLSADGKTATRTSATVVYK